MSKKIALTIAKAREILGKFHRRCTDQQIQKMLDLFTFMARSVFEKKKFLFSQTKARAM